MNEFYKENKGLICFMSGNIITLIVFMICDYVEIIKLNEYFKSEEGENMFLNQCEIIKEKRGEK